MDEKGFEKFLYQDSNITSEKAVATRMSRARKAERILGESLDIVVRTDEQMYRALLQLRAEETSAHSPLQNALRKYYTFIHNKMFPQLRNFR